MGKPIVRVHRPELTEEERARRMEEIKEAAKQVVIAIYKQRREKRYDIR